jgi:hypothetical protein
MNFRFKIFFQFLLLCTPVTLFAKEWVLSDNKLQVTFDDRNLLFKVLDKRCNKIWQQAAIGDTFSLVKTTQAGNALTIELRGKLPMTAVVELTKESELLFTLSSTSTTGFKELKFPASFTTPAKEHYLLQTDTEGMLLPVDDTEYP